MKSIITNAAEITVLGIIDNNYKTGGGPVSVGATVIEAGKGPVGQIVSVTNGTWEDIFGKPLHKKAGAQMEGLRHLADAAKYCSTVNVVRVVASDARFPSIAIKQELTPVLVDKGDWTALTAYVVNDMVTITDNSVLVCILNHTSGETEPTGPDSHWEAYVAPTLETVIENDEHAYGTVITIGEGYVLKLWVIDGDPSTNRKVEITDIDPVTERFTLKFYDEDETGEDYLLEEFEVGVKTDDKDDMGRSAFIETVLEEQSEIFRCDYNDDMVWADIEDSLEDFVKTTFTGGANGGAPTASDYTDAWDLFRPDNILSYLMFAAGNYDETVLANCIEIADLKHVMFFFDISPALDATAAVAWLVAAGLESRHAAVYYSPYSATDRWHGGKTIWGISGQVAAACAKGDANFSGATPGVHYAPAGIHRGRLDRTGIVPLHPEDVIDRDVFYTNRINPVIAGATGGAVIDDCLTIWSKQNYSRFVWVNRIADYIDHRFLEAAGYAKFEPDGLTYERLFKLTTAILDEMVTSGAVVTPRDPESDGTEPYIIEIEQKEIDLWLVKWSFCPTGAARRIAGQPRLIK